MSQAMTHIPSPDGRGARTETVDSAGRVLDVLFALFEADYLIGLAPGEIARGKLTPSSVTRYLATLEGRGAVERVPDSTRVRPSVRWARLASGVLTSLDAQARRAEELKTRILTDHR